MVDMIRDQLKSRPAPAIRRRRRRYLSWSDGLVYAILIAGCLLTLVPFIWTILASFKTHAEIIDPANQSFLPQKFTASNYETIFADPELPLERFYFNSAFVAVSNVAVSLFTSSLFGFVFAKYTFRGQSILFGIILATMMIPSQVTMIPGYLLLVAFDLTNNLWGLVLPGAFSAFGVFLMRQFIQTIPDELLDAARIDGASEWQTYFRVVLPQLGPALATYGTLVFMGNWNAYLWPLIVLKSHQLRTLPIILTWYNTRNTSNVGLQMAASVLIVMPILVVYFIFQKWIVRGFTLSGFKG